MNHTEKVIGFAQKSSPAPWIAAYPQSSLTTANSKMSVMRNALSLAAVELFWQESGTKGCGIYCAIPNVCRR